MIDKPLLSIFKNCLRVLLLFILFFVINLLSAAYFFVKIININIFNIYKRVFLIAVLVAVTMITFISYSDEGQKCCTQDMKFCYDVLNYRSCYDRKSYKCCNLDLTSCYALAANGGCYMHPKWQFNNPEILEERAKSLEKEVKDAIAKVESLPDLDKSKIQALADIAKKAEEAKDMAIKVKEAREQEIKARKWSVDNAMSGNNLTSGKEEEQKNKLKELVKEARGGFESAVKFENLVGFHIKTISSKKVKVEEVLKSEDTAKSTIKAAEEAVEKAGITRSLDDIKAAADRVKEAVDANKKWKNILDDAYRKIKNIKNPNEEKKNLIKEISEKLKEVNRNIKDYNEAVEIWKVEVQQAEEKDKNEKKAKEEVETKKRAEEAATAEKNAREEIARKISEAVKIRQDAENDLNNKIIEANDAWNKANATDKVEDWIDASRKAKEVAGDSKKYQETLEREVDIRDEIIKTAFGTDKEKVLANDISKKAKEASDNTKKWEDYADRLKIFTDNIKNQYDKDLQDASNLPNSASCNFNKYQGKSEESTELTSVSFIHDNINFKCGGRCNVKNDGFKLCFKVKSPDSCSNCIEVDIMPSSGFTSIKDLLNGKLLNGRKAILASEKAVNSTKLGIVVINKISCLVAKSSYGDIPIVCKDIDDNSNIAPTNSNFCKLNSTNSRVPFNFSGAAIECLKESLDIILYGASGSGVPQTTSLKPLASFQHAMSMTVRAALILYMIFFGMKMLLIEGFVNPNRLITAILKILAVTYFAVGIGPITYDYKAGEKVQANGIRDHFLPLLSAATSEFAHMVFSATSGQGLCQFNVSDYPEAPYYALADTIDCRIGYYLGFRFLHNRTATAKITEIPIASEHVGEFISGTEIPNIEKNMMNIDGDHAIKIGNSFALLTSLLGMFLSGQIITFLVVLVFAVIFLIIAFNFIILFMTCLISLYGMCYVSPIFIPMILFEKTKSIFDGWLKITVSFALQPAVVAGFTALFLSLMDSAMYKTCQFIRHDYQGLNNRIVSTFELRIPSGDEFSNKYGYFQESGKTDAQICKESVGYKLMELFSGKGWHSTTFIIFDILVLSPDESFLASMFVILVFCIIFYFFVKQINEFAAQVTSGVSIENMAIPFKMFKSVMQSLGNTAKALRGAINSRPENGASDKFSARGGIGGGGVSDRFSVSDTGDGVGRASDKFSSGASEVLKASDKFSSSGSGGDGMRASDKFSSSPSSEKGTSAKASFSTRIDDVNTNREELWQKLKNNINSGVDADKNVEDFFKNHNDQLINDQDSAQYLKDKVKEFSQSNDNRNFYQNKALQKTHIRLENIGKSDQAIGDQAKEMQDKFNK